MRGERHKQRMVRHSAKLTYTQGALMAPFSLEVDGMKSRTIKALMFAGSVRDRVEWLREGGSLAGRAGCTEATGYVDVDESGSFAFP